MQANEVYCQRKEEIKEFYDFLCYVDKIETYKKDSLIYYNTTSFNITLEFVKNLKAQFLLLLYNAVESTVRSLISDLFDTILDNHLKFKDLSHSLKKAYIEQEIKKDARVNNIRKYVLDFVTDYIYKDVEFDISSVDISGNIDMCQVKELSKRYGFPNSRIYSNKGIAESLLKIKNSRNHLAHGDVSFCNKGGMFILSDLTKLKDNTFSFLEELIKIQKKYIDMKTYLAANSKN